MEKFGSNGISKTMAFINCIYPTLPLIMLPVFIITKSNNFTWSDAVIAIFFIWWAKAAIKQLNNTINFFVEISEYSIRILDKEAKWDDISKVEFHKTFGCGNQPTIILHTNEGETLTIPMGTANIQYIKNFVEKHVKDEALLEGQHGKKTKKKISFLKIVLIIIAVIILVPAALVILSELIDMTTQKMPVEEKDKNILVKITDMTSLIGKDFTPNNSAQSLVKKKMFDDSYEIEYQYIKNDLHPYLVLYNYVMVEKIVSDADMHYKLLWGIHKKVWGFYIKKLEIKEDSSFYSYGKKSRFAFLLDNDKIVGNVFIAKIDRKVFFLLIIGEIGYNDKTAFANLVKRPLANLKTYRP